MARSSKGLAMGIVEGVTGVATKPFQGARDEGVGGFFKGVGKGVVGLVARPTGGIIDFASGTFDSVKRVTENTEEVWRVRPPRFLHPDGVVRYYNLREATGHKYLSYLDKGRYAHSGDVYVAHEIVQGADKESVILVTSKRIVFIVYQQVLGNWTSEWEFSYPAITGPPSVAFEDSNNSWYIVIKPKEDEKAGSKRGFGGAFVGLFSSGPTGKKVFVQSKEAARNLARVIEQLRTSQN